MFFNFDSSIIKTESYKPLEEVVKLMKSQIDFKFVVEGYCDSVGSSAYNLSLSNRRAGSVKRYFISKGVPANRISAIGYGEANPIATNMTEEGRAKNRRVEIKAKK
ncbi:MAG: OmpA family protein [Bacteroidota bacterium]